MKATGSLSMSIVHVVVCGITPTCLGFAHARSFSLVQSGVGTGRSLTSTASVLVASKAADVRRRRRSKWSSFLHASSSVSEEPKGPDRTSQDEQSGPEQRRSSSTAESKSVASDKKTEGSSVSRNPLMRKIVSRSVLVGLLSLLVVQRKPVLAFLSYVKDDWLYTVLDRLEAAGPFGLLVYAVAFYLWECTLGITTPIETAAGIAFGSTKACIASGSAKFFGAVTAFLVSRYLLRDKLEPIVKRQELLQLIGESIEASPLRVAVLLRFAPLPEFVKNCGTAILPLPLPLFIASLLIHGLPFSCLWSCLGGESAKVMRGGMPSKTLKILMTTATWIGISMQVGIAYWIKSLRDKQVRRHNGEGDVVVVNID